jgi:hypothetical protein
LVRSKSRILRDNLNNLFVRMPLKAQHTLSKSGSKHPAMLALYSKYEVTILSQHIFTTKLPYLHIVYDLIFIT